MYWKNEQTTAKESPSKNTVSVSDTLACVHFSNAFYALSIFVCNFNSSGYYFSY